jgi:hypothetical protein
MKNSKNLFIIIIGLIGGLQACTYDKREIVTPNKPGGCDTSKLSYCSTIKTIIDNNCNTSGCHVPGGGGTGDLTTYVGVKAKVDDQTLKQRVIIIMDMPPAGPLSANEIQKINNWITAGAPEN